ncbi:argininosuccinate lyase [Helicobacter mustelae]|uniref:Argininosuccinate lyase n=1 Tax=Helicobacter mustelae (strain ATCC 43772 / CCUG 25715 / CIP 103759 / LMG 18044 / NCTC 12198 / R85-136P) TaxID=679897 RepID=D3UHX5_HELM1|nr:argininosuccinate lyase [Helicobacter mustelae]CBG40098.1 argininosuccinate lyase [Helicobacter mustelae 12198]SQH71612.1 argininosuccinate lyase [Helicobacter mustelae]STP12737.1 argininosuccinate lyase [Helicobacter mustelae]
MAKLWGGRFGKESAKLLELFNASIPFDYKLWRYDILGSKTHAKMLHQIGVLDAAEYDAIIKGLLEIGREIEAGEFVFDIVDEDIHMAIEKALIQKIGDVGKKLHTARSRNDQVALDFRLYVLDANAKIQALLQKLMRTLLEIAKHHTEDIMPGMTHLQHAQPINFGFHLVAWCANLKRDIERLQASFLRNNYLPLGSGALAGTPYKNDRLMMAEELGFIAPTLNAMDSVSERDFALDLLYDIAMISMHISRIAEELVLWSSYEFGFISLSDDYTTGSSIMPQKKNPDVPELLRGKSGRIFGNLIALLVVMKGLPFAYNKDTQEDKEGVFDSVENIQICLEILSAMLQKMQVNPKNMLQMAKIGHLSATDLADFLVRECGVPFREAHHITGEIVLFAEKKGLDLSELEEEEILSLNPKIKKGVKEILDLRASMDARDSLGGTASAQTKEQIRILEAYLDGLEHGK